MDSWFNDVGVKWLVNGKDTALYRLTNTFAEVSFLIKLQAEANIYGRLPLYKECCECLYLYWSFF